MKELVAVVLAAGESSRLGTPKQLVQWQGQSLLQRTVQATLDAGATHVYVVSGAYHEQITENLSNLDCSVLQHTAWQNGMGSSVGFAVQQVLKKRPHCDSLMIAVCDQPGINGSYLSSLVDAFQTGEAGIAASSYAGVVGTPVLFAKKYFGALMQLIGEKGAGKLIGANREDVISLEFPAGAFDIDTPADLQKLNECESLN